MISSPAPLFAGAVSVAVGFAGLLPARAAPEIRAEFASTAAFAGDVVTVRVLIDGDDAAPGLQPVANGLFNAGVRVVVPAGSGIVPVAVRSVAALDHSGFTAGARTGVGTSSAFFEGNIDLGQDGGQDYFGNELAEFDFLVPAGVVTTMAVPLVLELPKDQPSQTITVDGQGTNLDSALTFAPASVTVLAALRISRAPGAVALTFGTATGYTFEIQASPDLGATAPGWTPLPGAPHNGGSANVPLTDLAHFFRVVARRDSP